MGGDTPAPTKHRGGAGEYQYTGSRKWVRLVNIEAFYEVLKMKYNL